MMGKYWKWHRKNPENCWRKFECVFTLSRNEYPEATWGQLSLVYVLGLFFSLFKIYARRIRWFVFLIKIPARRCFKRRKLWISPWITWKKDSQTTKDWTHFHFHSRFFFFRLTSCYGTCRRRAFKVPFSFFVLFYRTKKSVAKELRSISW